MALHFAPLWISSLPHHMWVKREDAQRRQSFCLMSHAIFSCCCLTYFCVIELTPFLFYAPHHTSHSSSSTIEPYRISSSQAKVRFRLLQLCICQKRVGEQEDFGNTSPGQCQRRDKEEEAAGWRASSPCSWRLSSISLSWQVHLMQLDLDGPGMYRKEARGQDSLPSFYHPSHSSSTQMHVCCVYTPTVPRCF